MAAQHYATENEDRSKCYFLVTPHKPLQHKGLQRIAWSKSEQIGFMQMMYKSIQLLFRSGIVDPVEIITGGPDQAFPCVGIAIQRDIAFGMSGEALRGLRIQIRTAHGDEGVPEDMRGCTVQIDARANSVENA